MEPTTECGRPTGMNRLLAVVAALLLTAGCGNAPAPAAQAGPTASTSHVAGSATPPAPVIPSATASVLVPTTQSPAPSASWSAWGDTQPTLAPGSCGSAALRVGDPALVYGGATSIRCFAQAASTCHPASLSWRRTGVDGGTEVHATVRPGGQPCAAMYETHDFTLNGGGRTYPVTTFVCGLSVVAGQIEFRCPSMDDALPVG